MLERHAECRPAVVEVVRRGYVPKKKRSRWRIWLHTGEEAPNPAPRPFRVVAELTRENRRMSNGAPLAAAVDAISATGRMETEGET
jgi:hypothetical protein